MGRGRRTLVVRVARVLAPIVFAAGCVDGVTPDCSDAATPCGPILDAAFDRAEAAPDASQDAADVFVPDAPAEADLDAGDEV